VGEEVGGSEGVRNITKACGATCKWRREGRGVGGGMGIITKKLLGASSMVGATI